MDVWFLMYVVCSGTFYCICESTTSYGSDHEYRLVRDLTKSYNKQVKPSLHSNQALNISYGVALAQIIDLDEKNQIITTNCWINQMWTDPKLSWDPRKYGNVTAINLPYDTVWLPDIVLYNSAHITDESVSTNVIVDYNGTIMWLQMVILKSSCEVDVKYFPFDTQHCVLEFASWTYDSNSVNLVTIGSESGDVTNYKNSTEWELVSYLQERQEVSFSCCPVPYVFIKNHIRIKRRPLFYVFNMVFPCILITMVALLGFYMPADSGEKIAMGITTLLSMTVFLMIVADKMPPTSEDLPLVGLYYGITIAIVSFATVMTVFVLNIHYKGSRGRQVPKLLKKICFGFIAKLLFLSLDMDDPPPDHKHAAGTKGMQPVPTNDYYSRYDIDRRPENGGISPRFTRKFTPTPSTPSGDNTERQFLRVLQKVYQTIEKNEIRLEDQDRKDAIKIEWQQLALVIDRLLLVIFVVFTIAITLALILPGYYAQSKDIE
ncbi:neuronal acetylcholine receptor subunit alpha-10-like isoform X2 [Biomphalaria glabrata]|uniref:Neuronal acetylcholine receptor subunit alpha-10-like isoform X2 n=1 Tax=Biomphalaria glabrata TaxID=6526 RepID=A0A9W3B1D6_BIOGL|nr:neuronal acetylcholine receptor subunit alpha-10-like isoform X2 [Biomphalaria glabrata]